MVSPHYDDAPLSLGQSLIDGELSRHRVTVSVLFGRSNWVQWFQPTRARWPLASAIRLAEERYNSLRFGYRLRCSSLEEAVLRLDDQRTETFLNGDFVAADDPAFESVLRAMSDRAEHADLVLAPLGLGHHIDHQLAASAAVTMLTAGTEVGFYEDRPYAVLLSDDAIEAAAHRLDPRLVRRSVSPPMGRAKHRRIFYPSQFDGFFRDAIADDERHGRCEHVWVLPESTFALG